MIQATRPEEASSIYPTEFLPWQLASAAALDSFVQIIPPAPGKVRMRKVATRGAKRPTFKHFSITGGRILQTESSSELDLSFVLDAMPIVTSYGEQPFAIEYWHQGRINLHVPDFAATVSAERMIFEVKKDDWNDPDVQARTALMKQLLAPHRIRYELIGPGSLPKVLVHNSVALLQRARYPNTLLGQAQLNEHIRSSRCTTLGELGWNASRVHGVSVAREIIEGRLHVDIARPLSDSSPVALCAAHLVGGVN
jgi:hypothetical protein